MDNYSMIDKLKKAGISFERGMTELQLTNAESVFQFRFPQEIREFLFCGVPVGPSFFDYRDLSEDNLTRFQEFAASIEASFLFDLKNNREDLLKLLGDKLGFSSDSELFDEAVINYLKASAKLIPFFAHRCFFDGLDDMPIVSFWQSVDTILYGGTFENYLEHEFLNLDCVSENLQERLDQAGIWKELLG